MGRKNSTHSQASDASSEPEEVHFSSIQLSLEQ